MVTERQERILRAVPNNAYSSTSIAWDLHEEAHWIASTLKALERKGLIECVKRGGGGLPSEWQRTEAGREYLDGTR